jgi:hypothetical protein
MSEYLIRGSASNVTGWICHRCYLFVPFGEMHKCPMILPNDTEEVDILRSHLALAIEALKWYASCVRDDAGCRARKALKEIDTNPGNDNETVR